MGTQSIVLNAEPSESGIAERWAELMIILGKHSSRLQIPAWPTVPVNITYTSDWTKESKYLRCVVDQMLSDVLSLCIAIWIRRGISGSLVLEEADLCDMTELMNETKNGCCERCDWEIVSKSLTKFTDQALRLISVVLASRASKT